MFDIAVIGLGPAGAAFARLAAERFSVVAIDKKYDDARENIEACSSHEKAAGLDTVISRAIKEGQNDESVRRPSFRKPCGGLLSPDAQRALSRFSLTLPHSVMVDPQIFSVRTIDLDCGQVRHYSRFYINMDRHKFDLWLRDIMPDSVTVIDGARCTQLTPVDGGHEVTYRKDGVYHTVRAKYVVGADGASSVVRRAVYPKDRPRHYLAVQQWFTDRHKTPFYSSIFDSDTTDCYAWGVSKNEHFIFGGAFAPKEARYQYERLKLKLNAFGFCLDNPVKTEACIVLRTKNARDFKTGRDNIFLLGEAAGFISPSSLEGISYAFESARLLYLSLAGAKDENYTYFNMTRKIRRRLLLKHAKMPFMYRPFLRNIVMKSGVGAIDIIETQ